MSNPQPDVLFQHFYYPTPDLPPTQSWWNTASKQLKELSQLGVWGVWHPVPCKGGSGKNSMGYDPYDLYDLGSKDQRGTIPTHFGTQAEYLNYVTSAHQAGLRVIADTVLNHTGGADRSEVNPIMQKLGWTDVQEPNKIPKEFLPENYNPATMPSLSWTSYTPKGANGKPGTGRFSRNWRHFHPSALHPDRNSPYHSKDFGEDYDHYAENKYVFNAHCDWAEWFLNRTGIDGLRLDMVKHMEPDFLCALGKRVKKTKRDAYLVGEFWDTNQKLLSDFIHETQGTQKIFDFGFFYGVKDLVTQDNFEMKALLEKRFADREQSVMFVSNHDVDRFDPIPKDKRGLPHALMLAMSGQPCLFYHDYFSPEDTTLPMLIKKLVAAHNAFAWGKETILSVEKKTLILRREGGLLAFFNGANTTMVLDIPREYQQKRVFSALTNQPETLGKTLTLPAHGFAYFAPRPVPAVKPLAPLPTTQIFTFEDDLETGELGDTPRHISLQFEKGQDVSLKLEAKNAQMLVTFPDGRTQKTNQFRPPVAGLYTVTATSPGVRQKGKLTFTTR
jgi:alpha-amylase